MSITYVVAYILICSVTYVVTYAINYTTTYVITYTVICTGTCVLNIDNENTNVYDYTHDDVHNNDSHSDILETCYSYYNNELYDTSGDNCDYDGDEDNNSNNDENNNENNYC